MTTLPWTAEGPTQNSESYDCWYVKSADGTTVAETDAWNGRDADGPDARLIVRAVNCHQELLEALVACSAFMRECQHIGDLVASDLLHQADRAIAHATGG